MIHMQEVINTKIPHTEEETSNEVRLFFRLRLRLLAATGIFLVSL